METLSNIYNAFINTVGPGGVLLIIFMLLIGVVAKWKLFAKADQPALAAFIPIYDLIAALRMVGRPDKHILYFLIPVFNVFFGFKLLIEVAQSFGKFQKVDYFLVVLFNIFYMFNLGLSYEEEYEGPVYGKPIEDLKLRHSQQLA
ncbi:DUF5684 domain-containing protein [Halocola ammonii]